MNKHLELLSSAWLTHGVKSTDSKSTESWAAVKLCSLLDDTLPCIMHGMQVFTDVYHNTCAQLDPVTGEVVSGWVGQRGTYSLGILRS
jgi:hypothetical protein